MWTRALARSSVNLFFAVFAAGRKSARDGWTLIACGLLILAACLVGASGVVHAQTPGLFPQMSASEDQTPLTPRERQLLQRIQELEDRLKVVEAKIAGKPGSAPEMPASTASTADPSQPAKTGNEIPDGTSESPTLEIQSQKPEAKAAAQGDQPAEWKKSYETEEWGSWDPGKGFLIGRTKLGELNISGYALVRWINQTPTVQFFVDHLGNVQQTNPRNDIQFHRVLVYFTGFFFNPKFKYNIFVWAVNSTGQVAVVGALSYDFNKHLILAGGVNGLPGTRSLQGSHPYWPAPDRVMADEFFRPGFTGGVWASGELFPRLYYRTMLGDNLNLLGLNAAKLTRDLASGTSFAWMPTTGEFGPRGGFGDYEWHESLATRLGVSYTYAREDRFNEIVVNQGPDNTAIRLADSSLLFATGSLAPGVTVLKATYSLLALDAGFKTHGFFIQGEGYSRLLSHFQTDGPIPMATIRDHGFYVQAAQMVVPKKAELYGATSYIFGDTRFNFRQSHEWLGGVNYYPAKNRNLRMNVHIIHVTFSPVSSVFGYYTAGQHGTTYSIATNFLF